MGARKKRGYSMVHEVELADKVAHFVASFHKSNVLLHVPHRLKLSAAALRPVGQSVQLLTQGHHIPLDFGPFSYFFLKDMVEETFGEALVELVNSIRLEGDTPKVNTDMLPVEYSYYADAALLWEVYRSTRPCRVQFAPLWKYHGAPETPYLTMVDGPLPGTTGYWKTRVSEVTRPLLERALRRSGCFYEFDAGTGMLFYSNLRSVALGMPPACGSLALHRPELLPGIFRLLVRESLDYHQVLKYVAKREAKQWPVWVNDKTFRYFATNQVSGVHQGDDNVVMVNPELDNTGAEEGVNGLL